MPIRDVFPIAPAQITISVYTSPDAGLEWNDKYRNFISSAVKDSGLPIDAASDGQYPHIVVFFFKRGISTADTPRLVGQFQKIPHRSGLFPEYQPLFEPMIFNLCNISAALTADAKLKDVTIFVPFDGATGELISDAGLCVRQGLLKAFGVGLNRDAPTEDSLKSPCPECDDIDQRMARVLHDNSQSAKAMIRAEEMVRRLAGPRC